MKSRVTVLLALLLIAAAPSASALFGWGDAEPPEADLTRPVFSYSERRSAAGPLVPCSWRERQRRQYGLAAPHLPLPHMAASRLQLKEDLSLIRP